MHFRSLIFTLLISFSGAGLASSDHIEPYPQILMYQGNPLLEAKLHHFICYFIIGEGEPDMEFDLSLPISKDEEQKASIEWEYLGELSNHHHAMRVYAWPENAMGKFSGVIIFKRHEDKLWITDMIYGGDRHASMLHSATLSGNVIHYRQNATTASFMYVGIQLFPELKALYEKSSHKGICYGEACFAGSFGYEATINNEGKVASTELISFTPREDAKNYKTYLKSELKDMIIAHLKEMEN